ncbi:hypothetical protein GCM10010969_02540 [Saccharibacillus kuerlensis]|uniref:Transcriptional regulator n=1 Tax=Saccharibacillus kuerlensis TaxID=459527 RepID=A0ABQ2KRK8_9BACL|nr:hypothetical protein GCM10010969_02540 [Saccharibacillus kuerlensis]
MILAAAARLIELIPDVEKEKLLRLIRRRLSTLNELYRKYEEVRRNEK